jgi:hypothetical protein
VSSRSPARAASASQRLGQLPAEVVGLLDAGVEALPARGRVGVGGVAGADDEEGLVHGFPFDESKFTE